MDATKPAHEIIGEFVRARNIDMADFAEWFADAGYPESEANIHGSRYLDHLAAFAAERDAGKA